MTERLGLGSVAQRVVRDARCSVEVVRDDDSEATAVSTSADDSRWAHELADGAPPP